jgi:hypothetical protein
MSHQRLEMKAAGPNASAERRRAVRHAGERLLRCRVASAADGQVVQATVLDVSTTGIGLLSPRPLAEGDAVAVRLSQTPRRAPIDLTGRVVYCSRQPGARYVLGCTFDQPVAEDVLAELIG